MNRFADTLLTLRRREGLSQQELAEKLGLAKSTISMYENGARKPSYEILEALSALFGVSVDVLMGAEPVPPARPEEDMPEITVIARAGKRLSPERRADMLRMLQIAFPDAFREDD